MHNPITREVFQSVIDTFRSKGWTVYRVTNQSVEASKENQQGQMVAWVSVSYDGDNFNFDGSNFDGDICERAINPEKAMETFNQLFKTC